jgi:hypothetical protein
VTLEVRTGEGRPVALEIANGAVRTRPASAEPADAVVSGAPRPVLGVLTGRLTLAEARAQGVSYEGDPSVLRRLQPS